MKFLLSAIAVFSLLVGCNSEPKNEVILNDVHSRLNETHVDEYQEPSTEEEMAALVRRAAAEEKAISISGGRHAMGGQQFGTGTLHINTARYNRVLHLDKERGLVTVESGITWPDLIDWLIKNQESDPKPWGIRQKQTGADRLSLGGAISANAHGRGLNLAPFAGDVESMEVIAANGRVMKCSREENRELFSLVAGGYGLFGIITKMTLRLSPRIKIERKVEIIRLEDVPQRLIERIQEGYLYGDYQFKTDETAPDFLEVGVFSFYQPVESDRPVAETQRELVAEQWSDLYKLAHLDKAKAFQVYLDYYLSTDGQIYWSDTHQLSYYVEGFDEFIDSALNASVEGSLMICEFYVPREKLPDFLRAAKETIRRENANLIYGTVRFIEKDENSFLAWAREPWATIVINLRVTHDVEGIATAQRQFQALIDDALNLGGSYFLTYHRWARKDQVLRAYPQFPEFLRLKKKYDPEERFQSDWYRHYREMFASELSEQN